MAQSYQDRVVADGAQYYWRLGETSGTTAVDRVSGVNGTISGGVTLNVPGGIEGNTAMTFNGTTGKIVAPANIRVPPCSFEVWLKIPATAQQFYFSTPYVAAVDSLWLSVTPEGFPACQMYYVAGGNTLTYSASSQAINNNQWHHVVWVFSGGTAITLYVDGVLQTLITQLTTAPTNIAGPVSIGTMVFDPAQGWSGSLDDVAIYPRALTTAQIRDHYTLGIARTPYAPGSYPALVLKDGARNYWRLGESSGTTAVDVVGGVNGTISGGVTLGQAGALGDGDKAMGFNGTTGKITTAATIPLLTPSTIEVWFKASSTGNVPFVSTRQGYPTLNVVQLKLQVTSGFPTIVLDYANATSPEQIFSLLLNAADGQWHSFVVVVTALNVDLYFDGAFAAPSHVLPATFAGASVVLDIAKDNFDGFGACVLDEVAIYPLALTAAQVAAHYAARTLPYVPGTYPARVIASGPSNYWRLGESSGATAVDLVGGANGTISGGVTLGQKGALSEPDTAMGFDGVTGQVVTTPTNVSCPLPCTIELWMKTSVKGLSYVPMFSNRSATVESSVFAGVDSEKSVLYLSPTPYIGITVITDGQWHHLVWVTDGTTTTGYCDGVVDGTPGAAHARIATSHPAGIAFDIQGGSHFPGSVDDVAVYPRALPLPEILAHYQAKLADMWDPRLYPPTSPPTTGPVAYPAVTSPYPQPPGTPEYAPRPAPTLTTLTPSSATTALGFQRVDLTGTNFTNASRISLAGVLDQFRVDETILYRDPTSLQITLDLRGLVAGVYQLGVVNQDSQASATLPFTVS